MKSHALIFSDFESSWYKRWAKELKQEKPYLGKFMLRSNKFWQNAAIVQALYRKKLLRPGTAAVGFGVGKERLPALFAKYGVNVTATDQAIGTKKAQLWQKDELARSLGELNDLGICDTDAFKNCVDFQRVDMTHLPTKMNGKYDVVWSNCSLGHLGTLQKGLDFIVASAKTLKPGGYAIHTTEVNVLSDEETLSQGTTVIFRPKDMFELERVLRARGYIMSPLRLTLGNSAQDLRVAMRPEFGNDFSKIQVGSYLATQVVLIIRRPKFAWGLKLTSPLRDVLSRYIYKRSLAAQQRFAEQSTFITQVLQGQKQPLREGDIKPLRRDYTVKLAGTTKDVFVEFKNLAGYPIFSVPNRLQGTLPVLLATSKPQDRTSLFAGNEWHNGQSNRVLGVLFTKTRKGQWQEAEFVAPGQVFAFRVTLHRNKVKAGRYTEYFSVVQEGNAHLSDTQINIQVAVV